MDPDPQYRVRLLRWQYLCLVLVLLVTWRRPDYRHPNPNLNLNPNPNPPVANGNRDTSTCRWTCTWDGHVTHHSNHNIYPTTRKRKLQLHRQLSTVPPLGYHMSYTNGTACSPHSHTHTHTYTRHFMADNCFGVNPIELRAWTCQ